MKRWGFSLLEVVVAMALLMACLLTVGMMIPRSLLHLRNKGMETQAVQYATQIIEEARGLDAAEIPLTGTPTQPVFNGLPITGPTNAFVPPLRPYTPRQFPPAPYPPDISSQKTVQINNDGTPVTVTYYFIVEVSNSGVPSPIPLNLRTMTVTVAWFEPQRGYQSTNQLTSLFNRYWRISSALGP